MGTMVGIIVGIGFIAVSGGLSSESLMDNITSLMTCVAIAMAASLVGICCTTLISWSAKSATSKVEVTECKYPETLCKYLLNTAISPVHSLSSLRTVTFACANSISTRLLQK